MNQTNNNEKQDGAFTALHILKEVVKLKGVYPSRDELRTDGPVTITLDSGNDLKTGKPEKK